jgi:hypothetical protein
MAPHSYVDLLSRQVIPAVLPTRPVRSVSGDRGAAGARSLAASRGVSTGTNRPARVSRGGGRPSRVPSGRTIRPRSLRLDWVPRTSDPWAVCGVVCGVCCLWIPCSHHARWTSLSAAAIVGRIPAIVMGQPSRRVLPDRAKPVPWPHSGPGRPGGGVKEGLFQGQELLRLEVPKNLRQSVPGAPPDRRRPESEGAHPEPPSVRQLRSAVRGRAPVG